MPKGFEQFNIQGGQEPDRQKEAGLSPARREEFLDELAEKEKRVEEIKKSDAYRRHKEVGVPFGELYGKEEEEVQELEQLEEEVKKIREALGMLLSE